MEVHNVVFLCGFFSQCLQSKGTHWRHKTRGREKEHPISSLIMVADGAASEGYSSSCESFSCNFFFHIYNVKLIVISTQQSGLGFQMIPWTETKILNVKSTDCETNLFPDHYWNWGIDSRKEDHEGSLHLHTWESLSHSSELLYFNMTKSQIKRSLIYFESLSYLALWF